MTTTKKYVLGEEKIPKAWYNLASDLPSPPPAVLHPGTGQPIGPGDLAPPLRRQAVMPIGDRRNGFCHRDCQPGARSRIGLGYRIDPRSD